MRPAHGGEGVIDDVLVFCESPADTANANSKTWGVGGEDCGNARTEHQLWGQDTLVGMMGEGGVRREGGVPEERRSTNVSKFLPDGDS
jgi:hypothetical protein